MKKIFIGLAFKFQPIFRLIPDTRKSNFGYTRSASNFYVVVQVKTALKKEISIAPITLFKKKLIFDLKFPLS